MIKTNQLINYCFTTNINFQVVLVLIWIFKHVNNMQTLVYLHFVCRSRNILMDWLMD